MPRTTASQPARTHRSSRSAAKAVSVAAAVALLATACGDDGDEQLETLNIDFATYNPLSLIILENGWLE